MRFSLSTLLLCILIVATALFGAQTYLRLRAVRKELAALKADYGELAIADESLLHVVQIPGIGHSTYRWRVYLPADGRYSIKTTIRGQSSTGGDDQETIRVEPIVPRAGEAESLVTFDIARGLNDEWEFTIAHDNDRSKTYRVPVASMDWLQDSSSYGTMALEPGKTVSLPQGKALTLLRRVKGVGPTSSIGVGEGQPNSIEVQIVEHP